VEEDSEEEMFSLEKKVKKKKTHNFFPMAQ